MIEGNKIFAIGTAYVDAKIKSRDARLPSQRNQLPEFLDSHPEAELFAGGSIPNIISTFAKLFPEANVKLVCCVGKDQRGDYYRANIDTRLGMPKVSRKNPTGIWVGIYDDGLIEDFDFYGAANDVSISRWELWREKPEILITDLDFLGTPRTLLQVQKALKAIKKHDGLFALSLGHVGYEPGFPPPESIRDTVDSLIKEPDIVFGNENEIAHVTGEETIEDAIKLVFPNAKLVTVTRAEKGAIIRFNKKILTVPTNPLSDEQVIDHMGAGDTFMGTMLAILMRKPYSLWEYSDVVHAAQTAHFASSLIVQSMHSQLNAETANQVLEFEKGLK